MRRAAFALFATLGIAAAAQAQDAQIAVAANFTAAAEELGVAFTEETGLTVSFAFGATGQFYAQITQGAPFDAFLSADSATPTRLVDEMIGVEGTQFTYAVGKLVLFSTEADRVTGPESLEGDFERLSIAEPAAAPYGAAAVQTIEALGLTEALADKLVIGQNISQAYQFVDTANAELGFVALAQVIDRTDGSQWVVEDQYYEPITQDAVLLNQFSDTAILFLEFLQSDEGKAIIETYGYGFADQ